MTVRWTQRMAASLRISTNTPKTNYSMSGPCIAAKAPLMSESDLVSRASPVRTAIRNCTRVLRTGERAASFHALCDIRDNSRNQQARVNGKLVLRQDELHTRGGVQQVPGLVVQIVAAPSRPGGPSPVTISAEPSPPHVDPVREDDVPTHGPPGLLVDGPADAEGDPPGAGGGENREPRRRC
jgi:hypothetical protein